MKKMVVIIDYVAGEKMRRFQEFEKYGFQIEYVYDHPEIQNHDAFSNMFLQFEKHDKIPGNAITKKYLIDRERRRLRRAADQEKEVHKNPRLFFHFLREWG